MREVYLDNAAATPADPRVTGAMARVLREPGNPASFNDAGRRTLRILDDARIRTARFLNARPGEVVFCASGSEANALALAGEGEVLTQPTEHRSVLDAVGRRARMLSVNSEGVVDAAEVARMLSPKTRIVSVMYANNEVGAIQPIKQIAKAIRAWRKKRRTPYPYLHVDACQAAAWLPMDVQALGADLVTLNGAKIHGPRGTAVLYVRRGAPAGKRTGSADVPGAAGLAEAVGLVRPADAGRVSALCDRLIAGILAGLPDARLNGPTGRDRLANNVNISVQGCSSEDLLLELDRRGIRAGAGSACTAHAVEPSHVLVAMKVPRKYLAGALRLTLSRHTTRAEVDRVVAVMPRVVARVRARNS